MGGAEPFGLGEDRGIGPGPARLIRNGLVIGAHHHRERGARSLRRGGQHMGQQRPPRHRVHHLRQRGPHPRAFAGCKYDGKDGSSGHDGACLFPRKLSMDARQ